VIVIAKFTKFVNVIVKLSNTFMPDYIRYHHIYTDQQLHYN
jgi:hypothetical protein